MNEQIGSLVSAQETHFLNVYPLVRRIASSKLSASDREAVEDLCQTVALRLWQRQMRQDGKNFSAEEWLRYANTVTCNEIKRFYGKRRNQHISLSEIEEREADYRFVSDADGFRLLLAGNTEAEAVSFARFLWRTIDGFSLRRKYALLLQKHSFIFELVGRGGCSVEDIAGSLKLSREEFVSLARRLPIWSDEDIRDLLEAKTGEPVSLKQLWRARDKAKRKLAAALWNLNQSK